MKTNQPNLALRNLKILEDAPLWYQSNLSSKNRNPLSGELRLCSNVWINGLHRLVLLGVMNKLETFGYHIPFDHIRLANCRLISIWNPAAASRRFCSLFLVAFESFNLNVSSESNRTSGYFWNHANHLNIRFLACVLGVSSKESSTFNACFSFAYWTARTLEEYPCKLQPLLKTLCESFSFTDQNPSATNSPTDLAVIPDSLRRKSV